MTDLLGPGDAGAAPTASTTSDVSTPQSGDTFFVDCPAGVADAAATPINQKWLNRMMQQLRVAIRKSGVPVAAAYDQMLGWAIQSGFQNWVGTFGGATNALTGSTSNNPLEIEGGTVVCGVVTTATNTGPTTFKWGALTAHDVLTNDGAACTGGEVRNGAFLVLRWDGGAWRICSPAPSAWLTTFVNALIPPPFAYGDVGSVFISQDAFVSGASNGTPIGSPTANGYTGVWTRVGTFNVWSVAGGGGGQMISISWWLRVP